MSEHELLSNKKIIAIIPARGGSKGIEKKNIRMFAGKPLIAHTIEQALSSNLIQRTFVSTDDAGITAVSQAHGAEVIRRPAEISGDATSSEIALLHALDYLENSERLAPDYVVFLQCTSPLRKPHDIDSAVQQLIEENADSLLSVTKNHGIHRPNEACLRRHLIHMGHDGFFMRNGHIEPINTQRQSPNHCCG